MRHLIIAFFIILTPYVLIGQKGLDIPIPFNIETDKYEYLEVVELSLPDSILYSNALAWTTRKFQNQDYELIEKGTKLIKEFTFEISHTIKAGMGIRMPIKYTILSDLILEFKPEKYRYGIINIKISQNENATTPESTLETFVKSYDEMGIGKKRLGNTIEEICLEIDKEMKALIDEMKVAITKKVLPNDDW
jgi:hypothetical protein